ncbi:MAG: MATE family efflux transporter [Solobacterium sp.]|nr:MATE family efflux transporter [Solobacterium sp.]
MPKMKNEYTMTEGNFRKKIINFAIPIFIGNLFQQLYNTVDSLIVGNYLGSNALAAVSSTSAFVYLIIGFSIGFSSGAGVIIARHIGANNQERTTSAVHTAFVLGFVISIVMSLFGVLFSPTILNLTKTPPEVYVEAIQYLRIYFSGVGALIMYNMFVGILQASGDSRHPLIYLIISSILNVILDILFIATFHMGVEGAAYATIISELVSMFLAARRLFQKDSVVKVSLNHLKVDMDELEPIIRQGLPTALQGSVIDISNMLIQSYINTFGSLAMAGIGAFTKVEGFIFLPVTAFSIAVTTFISQNLGANQKERAAQGIQFSYFLSILIVLIMGIIIYVYAPNILSLFNQNAEVIQYGVGRARVSSVFFSLVAFSHMTSAVMRGYGRPMIPMVVMLVCWCVVRIIVVYTIGQVYHDIHVVYWIYPFTWTLSTLVYLYFLKKLKVFQKD